MNLASQSFEQSAPDYVYNIFVWILYSMQNNIYVLPFLNCCESFVRGFWHLFFRQYYFVQV